jgi:hypothetical protein
MTFQHFLISKKGIERINEIKSWFFEKIKIYKQILSETNQRWGRRPKLILEIKTVAIITNTNKVKRIIRNLEEMD